MSLGNVKPHETYEGLKIQFFAMNRILECKNAEISFYKKRIKEFSVDRIIQLEADLESQREMNAILTQEIESLNNTI